MGNPTEADFTYEGGAAPPPYAAMDAGARAAPYPPAPSYQAVSGASTSGVAGASNRFPQSVNAYFPKNGLSKLFHIGEHADKPLVAFRMHSGFSGKPMLELHAGPDGSEPVIASAGTESRWGLSKTTVVKLNPAVDPSSSSTQQPATITMRETRQGKHITYPFSVEVGLGKDVRVEHFEWRGSGGGEVKELGKHARGYKLVRLGSDALGQGGERAARSAGASSDGKEIVAVFAANTSWSMNKVLKFQYLESGATGVLGDQFALAALVTGVKIWYVEFIIAQSTAASA
ncbi:hypothetical protein F4804DRAFT_335191 [Jackrogersella minutella]|nr:hypothetical protein F4804DRAFT_335191 [Jackrogersella minutella]